MLDAAAQKHDYEYFLFHTGGVTGALFNSWVYDADLKLAQAAFDVQLRYNAGLNDTVSGKPITADEATWAEAVFLSFKLLGSLKSYSMFH